METRRRLQPVDSEDNGEDVDRRCSLRKKKRVRYDCKEASDVEDGDSEQSDDEQSDVSTSSSVKDRFPGTLRVTCGKKKGILDVEKLKTVKECIECEGDWFSPSAFEQLGGKGSSKKWKSTILYNNKPLQIWLDQQHLTPPRFKVRPSEASGSSDHKECHPKATPLKKGEKGDIWTWAIYKVQLPVTCGDHKGTLNRDRLAKGEKCILVDKQWYTPSEFERLAGRASYKNWKLSIRCRDIPLGKLMQEGHLKTTGFKRGSKAKKSLFPYEETLSGSEEETEDDGSDDQFASSTGRSSSDSGSAPGSSDEQEEDSEEQNKLQSEAIRDSRNRVLRVSCEDISGLLHTKRFASGTCGKSIRTETRWMTPVDFVKEASCQTDVSWQRDIKCEGQPLGDLVKENEKNYGECWICRSDGVLVECDECPRSFHQKCHLPHIEDALLNNVQWMCTLCLFRKTLCLYPELEMEAAMSRTTSGHMLHCQYLLLGLYRADEDQIFTTDPCLNPRDYTSVIETPMWLGQIAVKLQEKKYQTVGEFVSDVQLIFANCASYNRDNPHFRAIGEKMEQLFERELKSVFKIREVTLNS